ncbi:hypothetical protein Hanom_Chr10g00901121 [Helianthus anomalus]
MICFSPELQEPYQIRCTVILGLSTGPMWYFNTTRGNCSDGAARTLMIRTSPELSLAPDITLRWDQQVRGWFWLEYTARWVGVGFRP